MQGRNKTSVHVAGRLSAIEIGYSECFGKQEVGEGDNDNLVGETSVDGSDASGSAACMKGLATTAVLKPGLPLVSANCVGEPWPRCCSRTLANLPANSESPTCRKDHVLQVTGSKSQVLYLQRNCFRTRYGAYYLVACTHGHVTGRDNTPDSFKHTCSSLFLQLLLNCCLVTSQFAVFRQQLIHRVYQIHFLHWETAFSCLPSEELQIIQFEEP
jgi:hypothetical protein